MDNMVFLQVQNVILCSWFLQLRTHPCWAVFHPDLISQDKTDSGVEAGHSGADIVPKYPTDTVSLIRSMGFMHKTNKETGALIN
jgi:hypothetical protein